MVLLLYRLIMWLNRFIFMFGLMVLCDRRTMYGCSHHYRFASSMGYPRSDSVKLLVLDAVAISGVPVLYYRSLRTARDP
jgi:hypothetical protein